MDLNEDPKDYHAKLEIPGVRKEDVELTIDRNRVTISAESKQETRRKDERVLVTERYVGQVYRSFTLPHDIDAENARARYEDGTLTLELPKTGNGASRRVPVN